MEPFEEPIRPPRELPEEAPDAAAEGEGEEEARAVPAPRVVIEHSMAGGVADGLGQDLRGESIRVSFNELPLPVFIDQVFGEELGLSYVIAPGLQEKPDLVTLRLTEAVPPAQLFDTARRVLREYGIDTREEAGVLTFALSDEIASGEIPLLISGRTLPEVPATHRMIFQLVPLNVVRPSNVRDLLVQAFDRDALMMDPDTSRNALVLSGKAEVVAQALAMVEVLDQPLLSGRQGIVVRPRYVKAEQLAEELNALLTAQGYAIDVGRGSAPRSSSPWRRPIAWPCSCATNACSI